MFRVSWLTGQWIEIQLFLVQLLCIGDMFVNHSFGSTTSCDYEDNKIFFDTVNPVFVPTRSDPRGTKNLVKQLTCWWINDEHDIHKKSDHEDSSNRGSKIV